MGSSNSIASATDVTISAQRSPISRWQPSLVGEVMGPGTAITRRINSDASRAVRSDPLLKAASSDNIYFTLFDPPVSIQYSIPVLYQIWRCELFPTHSKFWCLLVESHGAMVGMKIARRAISSDSVNNSICLIRWRYLRTTCDEYQKLQVFRAHSDGGALHILYVGQSHTLGISYRGFP